MHWSNTPSFETPTEPRDLFFFKGVDIPEGMEVPESTVSGWLTTEDKKHDLPYQVFGDLETADDVIVLHHGGPGGSIEPEHLQPFLGEKYKNTAIVVYNQRLSGRGNVRSVYRGEPHEAPLDSHTPDLLINDVKQLMDVLKIEKAIHAGGSWGSMLSMLFAGEHPEMVKNVVVWGVTNGEDYETEQRYNPNGRLARSRWGEYWRFIHTIPAVIREKVRNDSFDIADYYDHAMDPASEGYDQKLAERLAMAYGLLHTAGGDPKGLGRNRALPLFPTKALLWVGEKYLGTTPQQSVLLARLAMRYCVQHFRDISSQETDAGVVRQNRIFAKLGQLATPRVDVGIEIISGGRDLITPDDAAEKLAAATKAAGVIVRFTSVPDAQHSTKDARVISAVSKAGAEARRPASEWLIEA